MAQLEPLNLRITGNANGLSAELGRAQRDVDGFDRDLQSKAGGLSGLFSGIAGPIAAGVTAGFAALTTGAIAAAAAVNKVFSELDKIADKADVANKLAISFTELSGLEFSLGELTGLDSGTVDAAIQKLLVGLDEARTKASGPVKDALDRLGLDAGRLLQAGPVEALKQIAEQTRALGDPTAQLGIAYDLFGKNAAGLVNALRGGADAIEESYNFAAKWLGLTEAQVEAAAAASDSWARIGVIFDGLVQLGAAELAPLFKVLIEDFIAAANEIGGMQEAMRGFVDLVAISVGFAKDLLELLTANAVIFQQLSSGDFTGAADTLSNALAIDSGQKLLDRLQAEREAIEQSTQRQNEALPDPRVNPDTRFPVQAFEQEQNALLEQQRLESEKQDRRAEAQIRKMDESRRSLDRLLDAVRNQKTPIPVNL